MAKLKFEPPSWLDREGKAYWRRVTPSLVSGGILTPATADLLACAAQAYSTYREAQAKLKEQGRVIVAHTGAVKVNPWLAVEKQAFEMLARVCKDLRQEEPKLEDDDLQAFIDEGREEG